MVSVSSRLNELIVVFPPLPPYLLLLPIELVRCDGPRADCRHGIDPSSRAFLKQEAWTKEGAVVALDSTSAAPWRPFLFFSPEATTGEIVFAISRPVVVGREGERWDSKAR
jgi:hypothetical protein